MIKITCVLITFNPNIKYFIEVINNICINSKNIIIVDNGSLNINEIKEVKETIDIISLDKNVGIAAAQNIGIKKALESGADYIWLSDQDTMYEHDFTKKISLIFEKLNKHQVKYSVIGPAYIDMNTKQLMPFITYSPLTTKIVPQQKNHLVSHLVSSGMIIPAPVFKQVGYMREDLFIDWVDYEWCWRSEKMGYHVIGCGSITINHTLGHSVSYFLGKKIITRNPFRYYFIIRNGIFLSLYSSYISIPMKVEVFIKTVLWAFIYPMCSPNKIACFKATLLGIFDGSIAKLGAKSDD